MLEKIVHHCTYSFLDANDKTIISQFGFRSGHSCKNVVSELIVEIVKGKNNNKHTLVLFPDFSKAFDTLNHDLLLRKLEIYGIRGIALNRFKN